MSLIHNHHNNAAHNNNITFPKHNFTPNSPFPWYGLFNRIFIFMVIEIHVSEIWHTCHGLNLLRILQHMILWITWVAYILVDATLDNTIFKVYFTVFSVQKNNILAFSKLGNFCCLGVTVYFASNIWKIKDFSLSFRSFSSASIWLQMTAHPIHHRNSYIFICGRHRNLRELH